VAELIQKSNEYRFRPIPKRAYTFVLRDDYLPKITRKTSEKSTGAFKHTFVDVVLIVIMQWFSLEINFVLDHYRRWLTFGSRRFFFSKKTF